MFHEGLHLYLFGEREFHVVSVSGEKNGEQIYQGQETVILQALCSYLKNHIMADKAFG